LSMYASSTTGQPAGATTSGQIPATDAFTVGVVGKRGSCYSVAVGEQLVLNVILPGEGAGGALFGQAVATCVVCPGGYCGSRVVEVAFLRIKKHRAGWACPVKEVLSCGVRLKIKLR
jgi:hypothetical protein